MPEEIRPVRGVTWGLMEFPVCVWKTEFLRCHAFPPKYRVSNGRTVGRLSEFTVVSQRQVCSLSLDCHLEQEKFLRTV